MKQKIIGDICYAAMTALQAGKTGDFEEFMRGYNSTIAEFRAENPDITLIIPIVSDSHIEVVFASTIKENTFVAGATTKKGNIVAI